MVYIIFIRTEHFHMCFGTLINFGYQNNQFHMFEAMHTLSPHRALKARIKHALKARIKQMLYLCFL